MRPIVASFLTIVLGLSLLLGVPTPARAEGVTAGLPVPSPQLKSERDNVGWAELEAQKRALDGDYEGAVQAEQQAGINRRMVEQSEMLARSTNPRR